MHEWKKNNCCILEQRWLFDTTVQTGSVEIKCSKCKNVLKINFETNTVEYPKLKMVTAMSI